MRISFGTGVDLLDILTKENALTDFIPKVPSNATSNRLSPRLKRENVLKVLLTAVEEKPPRPLREIVERLGYTSASVLRQNFPQVCDQIKANYLRSLAGKKKGYFNKVPLQERKVLKAALESALKEESLLSLTQIAKSLGYKSSHALRKHFPELNSAVADKRRELISLRRNRCEGELKQALTSNPPISVDIVSKNLGYITTATLRQTYPELCRKIRNRYIEHQKTQLLSRIERDLCLIFAELPPLSLKAALRRIGTSDGFLRKYFPEERRALAVRYLKFRKDQSMKNKAKDRSRVRAIIRRLIRRGTFPSMNAVLDVFPASYLRRTEVWEIIQQARKEFQYPL